MSFLTLIYRKSQGRKANKGKRSNNSTPIARPKRLSGNGVPSRTDIAGTDDKKQSIKLTMKVAPSKLREVMRANEVESLQDTLGGGKVIDGPRSTRRSNQPRSAVRAARRSRYTEYADSDLEEDNEEEEEEEDNEEEVEGEPILDDFDEVGAEAEGGTDDEDVDMEDAPLPPKRAPPQPKPPKITLKPPPRAENKPNAKPKLIVTPANVGVVKSVEDQEMDDDPDDEEVEGSSDLSDNEGDTNMNDEEMDGEEDEEEEEEDEEEEGEEGEEGEGEEEELEEEEEDEDEEDDDDSSNETPASGMATPDLHRLTQRQRGRINEPLMALDMAPQQRKFFTDEEKAMKKDEHARKRKELTKRKTQEEKTAALNRLLKPQVSKSRGAAPKAETLAANLQTAMEEDEIELKAHPLYTRWISTRDGVKLGIPEEWLGKRAGQYFGPPLQSSNGVLVQEME